MAGAWQPSKAAALAGLGVHTWKLLAVEATSGAVPLLTGTILPAAGAGLARLLVSAPETPASPVSQRRRSHKLAETSEERPLAVLAGAGGQRATKRGSRILDFESASITSPRRFLSTSFASGRLMRKQSRRTGAEAKAVSTHEQPGITTLRCNLTNSRHSAAQRCLEPSQSVRLSFDELGGMLRQGQGQLDTGMEGARRQQMKPTLDDMDPSEPLMWYPRRCGIATRCRLGIN